MASILLQLHQLFDEWDDTALRIALLMVATAIVIIALVPEQKALRMVTLAYTVLP